MNRMHPYSVNTAFTCHRCNGAGTVRKGVIFLRLSTCRTCRGARFVTSAATR